MKNFEGLCLSSDLNKSLAKMQYSTPTPIQAQAIPLALEGRDVLGSAQTGTGKTAAFSIPLVEKVLRNPKGTALVLTPTRELAKQVLEVIHQLLGYKSQINTAFIIGGESMDRQFRQLRAKPRIIVGTPGRINDHLERRSMDLSDADFLVLDETDRMLDMGFGVQLDRIMKYMPQKRQTLMFSATMPNEIISISKKYLTNPERISMGATNVIATNIKQEVVRIEQPRKYEELVTQLHSRNGSVIIFVKTKHGADKMSKKLRQDGFTSDALHGDLRQNKRDKVMKNFRNDNFRVLVATDIAARGLDVPHIAHVINYDLPQVAEDYIHRMGRTARAGAAGSAISFVASQDSRKWNAIVQLLDPSAKPANENRSGKPSRSRKPRRNERSDRSERPAFSKSKSNSRGKFRKNNKREDRYGDKPDTRDQDRKDSRKDNHKKSNEGFKKKPFKARSKNRSGENTQGEDRDNRAPRKAHPNQSDRSQNWKKKRPNSSNEKPAGKFHGKPKKGTPNKNNGGHTAPKRRNNGGGKPGGFKSSPHKKGFKKPAPRRAA